MRRPDPSTVPQPRHGSDRRSRGRIESSRWTLPATALLLLGGTAYSRQTPQVTITELELLPGGTYSSAYGISADGKILGVANDAAGNYHAVQWLNGDISILPDLTFGGLTVPEDLNDAGEGVGTQHIFGSLSHAIFWDAQNDPSELPGIPGGEGQEVAHAINDLGQVAGRAQEGMPNLYGHAVVWYQGSLQSDLGFMGGGTYSEAYGINDLGAVVGVASVANTNQHAFLWQNGQFTDLSTWSGGGASSKALAINNLGVIVGLNANVASIWENGAVHALPMPTGVSAFTPAIDINDAGDIIATGSKGYPFDVGVLWRNGTPIDLGTLPGGTISRARRISATGEIVGEANVADGFFRAVKWTVAMDPGVSYCGPAVPNSTGAPAKIRATGSDVVADDDFHLVAEALPPKQFGYFLVSATQGFVANPGGSQGNLCLAGTIGRFVQQIQNSGRGGTFGIQVDLTKLPAPLNVAVQPGETWNFQAWYRDKNPTTTSNFTDGTSVLFQ